MPGFTRAFAPRRLPPAPHVSARWSTTTTSALAGPPPSERSDPPIKLLSLDCTGTLFTWSGSIGALYHRGFSRGASGFAVAVPSAAEIDSRFYGAFKEVDAKWPNFGATDGVPSRDWWEAVARRAVAGTPLGESPAAFDAGFDQVYELFQTAEAYEPFDDVRAFLEWAQTRRAPLGRGLKLCTLSNVTESYRDSILPALGLDVFFDFGAYSKVEGVSKPDPAAFHRVAARAGVTPAEVLHVGDHPAKDAAGARNAGCRALLLDRSGTQTPPDGVESVRSFGDVRRWMEARGV